MMNRILKVATQYVRVRQSSEGDRQTCLKTKVMEGHVHGEFNVIRHEDNNMGSFILKLDF